MASATEEGTSVLTVEEDQRLFARFMARFPVKVKDSRGDFGMDIFLRDASATGLKLNSRYRMYVNDVLNLLIRLPDQYDPMEVRAEVVWAHQEDSPNNWEIGMRFIRVDLMKMRRLFKFCNN